MEVQYIDQNNLKLFKKGWLKKIGKGLATAGTTIASTVTAPVRVVGKLAKDGNLKGFKPIVTNPKYIKGVYQQAGRGGLIAGGTALGIIGAKKIGSALKNAKIGDRVKINGKEKQIKGFLPNATPEGIAASQPTNEREGLFSGAFDKGKEIVKATLNKAVDNYFPIDGTTKYGNDEIPEEQIGFKELKIFKPAMSLAVREKGITPSYNIETLSRQFYDNVVRNTLEHQNHADSYQTPKEIVVDAVLKYFISSKAKKDSGADLTRIDEIAARGYEMAQQAGGNIAEDYAKQSVGDWVVENKGIVIGGIVGVILIIIILIATRK